MRVCVVSKFPPIEGGIAARTYWQVRRLLDDGHEVAVVTNSGSVEPEYRIAGCEEHLDWLVRDRGLRLHDISGPVPWHVPESSGYLERLLNELLGVLRSGEWDVIESGYLVPYGIAGHLASKLTGVPHVVHHGGSDIAKFLEHPAYATLLRDVLLDAQVVVTDDDHAAIVSAVGARTEPRPVYEIDESAFRPGERRVGQSRVCAYVGKINYHWRRKGLDQIVDWYAGQDCGRV
ncbi:MAG: glycosyltransferase, partial [Coriobacteriia bacterium]|nr:glycosyltransferase [Coriobacteriia bacterium]